MRFALIVPRGRFRSQRENILASIFADVRKEMGIFKKEDVEIMPNLGIVTIGSLIPAEHNVVYLDEEFMEPEEVQSEILDETYDVVLLTAMDNQALRAYQLADHHRAKGTIVWIGGFHASAMPAEALQHADAVVTGEGEYGFRELLDDLFAGRKFRPLYKSDREVDLTRESIPDFSLFTRFVPRYNKVPLMVTRGCPRDCEFCCVTAMYGRHHRHKTVEQVVAEVRALKRIAPRHLISVADENMFVDREFSKELLRALIPEKIRFEAYTDLSIADDPELLDLMRQAGCFEVLIGFETLDKANLDVGARWKAARLSDYAEAIATIQGHGIPIMGLFMVGFDHDGPDVFNRIRDFCLETNLYEVDFAIQTPIPGTALFERYRKEGRLLTECWDQYTWESAVFKPLGMSIEELEAGIRRLYEEFNTIEMIRKRRRHFKEIMSEVGRHEN